MISKAQSYQVCHNATNKTNSGIYVSEHQMQMKQQKSRIQKDLKTQPLKIESSSMRAIMYSE